VPDRAGLAVQAIGKELVMLANLQDQGGEKIARDPPAQSGDARLAAGAAGGNM
jgi:hypothetical protein